MKKILGILFLGLIWCNVGIAKSITLKDLINDGKIYEGMSKRQLEKTGGFPSFKKMYAEVFRCSDNTLRDYYPDKRLEVLAGGGSASEQRDVEGNRVFFVFKNVTKPSYDNSASGGTCQKIETLGNGILEKWFFTLEDAEDFVMKGSSKKKVNIEEFKQICTDIGLTLGSSDFVDCVLKLKSDDDKLLIEKQRLQSEEKIADKKQKAEQDKQELEQDKYDGEERIRKQKEYEKCLKKTAEIYGTPRKSCALELL